MYSFFKDFAGPLATLLAAITAVVVTVLFNLQQLRIARSQRDIAHDKLKFDLFNNRYAIYEAAKSLIEYVSFISDIEKTDANRIRTLYVTLDEARFYFPSDICKHLRELHDRCERFFEHLAERDRINLDDREKWSQMAEVLASDQSALRAIYASLPATFESSLAFKQITSS